MSGKKLSGLPSEYVGFLVKHGLADKNGCIVNDILSERVQRLVFFMLCVDSGLYYFCESLSYGVVYQIQLKSGKIQSFSFYRNKVSKKYNEICVDWLKKRGLTFRFDEKMMCIEFDEISDRFFMDYDKYMIVNL